MRYRSAERMPGHSQLRSRTAPPDADAPWLAPTASGLHAFAQPRLSAWVDSRLPFARLALALICLGQVGAWGGRIGVLHALADMGPGRALLWPIAFGFAAIAQGRFSRYCYGLRVWTGARKGALAVTLAQSALALVLCAATVGTAVPHISPWAGWAVISALFVTTVFAGRLRSCSRRRQLASTRTSAPGNGLGHQWA